MEQASSEAIRLCADKPQSGLYGSHANTHRRAGPIGEHHVLLILDERVAQRETRAQTDALSPYTSAFKRACVF